MWLTERAEETFLNSLELALWATSTCWKTRLAARTASGRSQREATEARRIHLGERLYPALRRQTVGRWRHPEHSLSSYL